MTSKTSKKRYLNVALAAALSAVFVAGSSFAGDVGPDRIANADNELAKGNWVTYNGSMKGWHYSPLNQITTKNIGKLHEAWSHVASRARRGIESMPLAIDGNIYYTGPYNQVYALDGATGKVLWVYKQKLNEDLVARQTHGPFNRGIAAAYGNIIIATLDGKVAAIDMKTGNQVWETKLIDSEKLTVGFTGIPMFVKDKIIVGAQGGEWPYRGPIFGVDAKTGKKIWEFKTVGGNEGTPSDRRDTWGGDSWKVGGGGAWTGNGSYDPETNAYWIGTSNPAPLFDWAGPDWQTKGPRPGINLYTTSVLLLDPDTGALKAFHQEIPHDAWDFDSAPDGFYFVEQGGKKYVVHPSKGGHNYIYDRQGKVVNVYKGVDNITFAKFKPTGEIYDRMDMREGKHEQLCPAINGGLSYNSGTYNPNTKLFYKLGYEWCMDLTVQKVAPVTEPVAQLYIGADFKFVPPKGEKSMHGHIRARDPVSGAVKFEITYPGAIPHSSLLSTAGGLLFVGEAAGDFVAHDVTNGKKLWSHNNGIGHGGGIITYLAKGKQYVAVATGWGSLFEEGYGDFFGEPWKTMPQDSGGLRVFAVD